MKRRTVAWLVLVLAGIGPGVWFAARPYYHVAVCRRHLREICKASLIYAGDFNEVYPDSLGRLAEFGIRSSVLTCPAVRTPPEATGEIDRWSGYRLVPGIKTDSSPPPVLVYCPPENHKGRWGHIAFADTHVEIFIKDEFDVMLAGYGIVRASRKP